MDDKYERLVRAAVAAREAYPRGEIGPNQMPPGAEANQIMDELEEATRAITHPLEDIGAPAFPLTKGELIARWLALRDEVGKVFERYAECPPGGKITFKQGMVKLDFGIHTMTPIFEAFIKVDDDYLTSEFDPQFWHGHDAACHVIIDILNRALVEGLGGSFGSAGLTEIVAKIIELRNKP